MVDLLMSGFFLLPGRQVPQNPSTLWEWICGWFKGNDFACCPYLLGKWSFMKEKTTSKLGLTSACLLFCWYSLYIANVIINVFNKTSTRNAHTPTLDLGKKPSTCKMFGKNPARHERQGPNQLPTPMAPSWHPLKMSRLEVRIQWFSTWVITL